MSPLAARQKIRSLRQDAAIFRYPEAQPWELEIAARLEAEAAELERQQEKELVQ